MRYTFNTVGSVNYPVKEFKNLMRFIKEYNKIKAELGTSDERQIINKLKESGYSEQQLVATKSLLNVSEIPAKEQENDVMLSYYAYMKEKYQPLQKSVIKAQETYNKKKYTAPEGSNIGGPFSSNSLRVNGERALKKHKKSTIWKWAIIAGLAVFGSYLLPLLTSALASLVAGGSISVAAASSLGAISSIAGLVGGGVLGNAIYNANGRGATYKNNKELANFYKENEMLVAQDEAELQAQQEELNQLIKDFDLELDANGELQSTTFNNLYDEFSNVDPEVEIANEPDYAETENEVVNQEIEETQSEAEPQEEMQNERTFELDPEIYGPEAETEEESSEISAPVFELDPEVYGPEEETEEESSEINAPVFELDPEVYGTEKENALEEFTIEESDVQPEEQSEPEEKIELVATEVSQEETKSENETEKDDIYSEPLTPEKCEKVISILNGNFTKAINICSAVGRYMLIDEREATFNQIRDCENVGQLKEIIEESKQNMASIKNDYKKYVLNKTGNNVTGKSVTYLEEIQDPNKKGKFADEVELPTDYEPKNGASTLYSAVMFSYVRQSEGLIKKYTSARYAEMTTKQRKQQAVNLYKKVEEIGVAGANLGEIDEQAIAFQKELAKEVKKVEIGKLSEKEIDEVELSI